jgi:hypothetical protein
MSRWRGRNDILPRLAPRGAFCADHRGGCRFKQGPKHPTSPWRKTSQRPFLAAGTPLRGNRRLGTFIWECVTAASARKRGGLLAGEARGGEPPVALLVRAAFRDERTRPNCASTSVCHAAHSRQSDGAATPRCCSTNSTSVERDRWACARRCCTSTLLGSNLAKLSMIDMASP